jgi:hypothetical protein
MFPRARSAPRFLAPDGPRFAAARTHVSGKLTWVVLERCSVSGSGPSQTTITSNLDSVCEARDDSTCDRSSARCLVGMTTENSQMSSIAVKAVFHDARYALRLRSFLKKEETCRDNLKNRDSRQRDTTSRPTDCAACAKRERVRQAEILASLGQESAGFPVAQHSLYGIYATNEKHRRGRDQRDRLRAGA